MRLSGWRKRAPAVESMSGEVVAVLPAVLTDLGAEPDPECWIAWGDDPNLRFSVLVPTMAGLIVAAVRPAGPEGAPRVSAKLIRWSKLTISELGVESTGGHRIVAVQVESIVLKGVDEEADRICEFVLGLIAGVDDRHPAPMPITVIQEGPVRAAADAAPTPDPGVAPAVESAVVPLAAVPIALAAAPTPEPSAAPKPDPASAPALPAGATRKPAARQAGKTALPSPAASQAAPEIEVDQSEWIPPHPIEAAAPRKPGRPRQWRP